jgi:hypothetical protein
MARKQAKLARELEMALWGCNSREDAIAVLTALGGDWKDPYGWTVEHTLASLEWLWRQRGWQGWPESGPPTRPLS